MIRNIFIIFKEPNSLRVRPCPDGAGEQFGSLVVKRRRGWRERGEGARKRDVCCILSNLSSWCWGLIAAAKDKWIISCCFHLHTIYCQIARSQNAKTSFFYCLEENKISIPGKKNSNKSGIIMGSWKNKIGKKKSPLIFGALYPILSHRTLLFLHLRVPLIRS